MFKKRIIFMLIPFLSGCYHQFDCPVEKGSRCKNVEQVDKDTDTGLKAESKQSKFKKLDTYLDTEPARRTQEQVLTAHIFEYKVDDVIHESTVIRFVATPAKWTN